MWNKTIVLQASGSDPSNVIVQENSWSVRETNAALLNISLQLTELPFCHDWNAVTKKVLVQSRADSDTLYCTGIHFI